MSDTTNDAESSASAPSSLSAAIQSLKRPGKLPADTEAEILALIKTFGKSNRHKVLAVLSRLALQKFPSLRVIRAVLTYAALYERTETFVEKFKGLLEPGAPVVAWDGDDRLKAFKNKFDYDLVELLAQIKYAQSPDHFDGLAAAVEFYAPRFRLPDGVADALYGVGPVKTDDAETFAAKLRQGFVVEHVLNDLCRRREGNDDVLPVVRPSYEEIWTDDFSSNPARIVDGRRKAAIFLTCHSGMLDHVKLWYNRVFEDGVRLGSGSSDKIVSSRDNPNAALLEAYRATMQGTPLLLAADSPMGTAKNTLNVFGRQAPVADGFVFLAFESRADVFWTLALPENGRLALRMIKGPSRDDGEKIASYRPRLLRFVEEQLEAYLAGPPEQISLRKKWIGILTRNSSADEPEEDAATLGA